MSDIEPGVMRFGLVLFIFFFFEFFLGGILVHNYFEYIIELTLNTKIFAYEIESIYVQHQIQQAQ